MYNVTFVFDTAEAIYPGDVFDFDTAEDVDGAISAVAFALNMVGHDNPPPDPIPTGIPSVGPNAATVFVVPYQRSGDDVIAHLGFLVAIPEDAFSWFLDDLNTQWDVTIARSYAKFTLAVPVESSSWGKIKAFYN